jgi:hypothetical protein
VQVQSPNTFVTRTVIGCIGSDLIAATDKPQTTATFASSETPTEGLRTDEVAEHARP